MEPGRPSLLSSCLVYHSTIGHEARPEYAGESDLLEPDLPLWRRALSRSRGIVNSSELPRGNQSGSAPNPRVGVVCVREGVDVDEVRSKPVSVQAADDDR